ncbi:histone-lysine N-methyltransferase, H3 lysine-9 specific SUVH1-like [Dorcoceras hygrometricum]|uniref:Histone-lysine N-methyltransferase, H3 lysine-9 specific SUVH1-like n=1 Tax=Dorcoceras hygrometricum TaxID=472368 RepID=A0A2Z7CPT0_9LAMI|nr:histone-lysine N-methyltransferase, H3 lysine-9 specific SUVH1-like [Dorcoceras hygrometricum]
MEQGLGSEPNSCPVSIDKTRVLDVRPLQCLVPIFPNAPNVSSGSAHPAPFSCFPPSGPFPPGVRPFYPFLRSPIVSHTSSVTQDQEILGTNGPIQAPVPLNSYMTPASRMQGKRAKPKMRATATNAHKNVVEDDGYNDSQNDQYPSGFSAQANDAENESNSELRSGRTRRRGARNNTDGFDVEPLVNSILAPFKLHEFDDFRRSNGDLETVRTILLVFGLLRRRLTQLEEANDMATAIARRPDLKAGKHLMTRGIRTNSTKRIGHVPGIEVGDIFFFRMELCIAGLHSQSMGGIDYLSVRVTVDEEPVALSIVSAGGYGDEGDGVDVLIYTGQGGVQRPDRQMFDQKLERGNLALEKSLHRANDVRVIRGCNVFKYKLVRVPGQPEAYSVWKSIQQWKDGITRPKGVILPDLTSGAESQPVTLINDVDDEKGPAHFSYISTLRYSNPFLTSKPSSGCHCLGGCQPGDTNCPCNSRNDGLLPYSSIGVLLTNKSLIYECGPNCACPPNCRNRMSQAGIRFRLEVFKTKKSGWGLRSWDPIRVGAFICEYAGDVISGTGDFGSENDTSYIFDSTRYYEPLELIRDSSAGYNKAPFPLVISAKNCGNVARFMNHSCSPNVFWQPVLRERNNDSYLHVAFFAIRHIPPMQELTYDYGLVSSVKGDKGKKKCLCESEKCRGYFY